MNKSMGCFVACLFGLVACNVEHYDDDCGDDDSADVGVDFGGTHGHGGSTASAGHASTVGGAATGGTASTQAGAGQGGKTSADGGAAPVGVGADSSEGGDGATTPSAPATPCEKERDCSPGYNCDMSTHQCAQAAEETCGELDTELSCTHRTDCTPVYGGVNCSCGKDCQCHGGEPGCVCESFQFFVCQDAR